MTDIKPLKYEVLNGISNRQLTEHHDVLYLGYLKKVDLIKDKLKSAKKENNTTYSDYRELNLELTFALNGVKLHEAYFANLGGDGLPTDIAKTLIDQDFKSFDDYKNDLLSCAMGARGWVVTGYDLNDNRLYNICCDAHNQGAIWNMIPLLVLDTYEHAYFIDYGTDKSSYLEAFMINVDFDYVNSVIKNYELDKRRAQLKAA